jgi:hypothetical protein
MRFENSAFEFGGFHTFDFYDFGGAGAPRHDANGGGGNAGEFAEVTDNRFVCFAVNRRGGNMQFPGFTQASGELGFAGSGADFKGESRFHAGLFYANE